MSESDSFINEVAEEVRRERLFGYLRRYGWIAVLLVLLLVGGAAYNEYTKAQSRAAAEATGDALLAALEADDPAVRAAAMVDLPAEGASLAVTALLRAATLQEAAQTEAAADVLDDLAMRPDVPQIYRDIAAFKRAALPVGDPLARDTALAALSQPGQPLRLLALEQRAYLALAAGDEEAAIALLGQIAEDAALSRGLSERVQALLLALDAPLTPPNGQ